MYENDEKPQQRRDAVTEVFESVDLIQEVAIFLVNDVSSLQRLTFASHTCKEALLERSGTWKHACHYRWKQKWGYAERWKNALLEEPSGNAASGAWWRNRYYHQEQDAKRTQIAPEELHSLVFDFRFWLHPYLDGSLVVSSGLRQSASRTFQFSPRQSDPQRISPSELAVQGWRVDHDHDQLQYNHRGVLVGHPSGRDDLEWLLDQSRTGIQWGCPPMFWPRGVVHRLDSWGWEVRNPNVCLRAIDNSRPLEREENDSSNLTNKKEDIHSLWGDYLTSMKRFPIDFGMANEVIAFLEVPDAFWDFRQNLHRFPQLGAGVEGHASAVREDEEVL